MSTTDHVLTRDEVRLALAERLKVPCDCNECHPGPSGDVVDTWFCQGKMLCCQGTGCLWPLREPCAYLPTDAWLQAVDHLPEAKAFALRRKALHAVNECGCEGRGWVPKDWHLEDLLWIWCERDCDPWSFMSLIAPISGTPGAVLEAAERALLKALEEEV